MRCDACVFIHYCAGLYPNNTREVILAGADSGAESDGMPRTVCECPLLPASEEASAAV